VTVLACGAAWSAGVDVRAGTWRARNRRTVSENLVGRAHAVVLPEVRSLGWPPRTVSRGACPSRGSDCNFGRVRREFHRTSAVLHDLGNGGDKDWVSAPLTATWAPRGSTPPARFRVGFRRVRDAAPWRD